MGFLENVFSWSKSRDEQFRDCQRKYFYDKYASWGGWDKTAPADIRLAYILKNLKNRWAWKGESVHHVIEEVLKSHRADRPLSPKEAELRLTEKMRADYRASKAKKHYEDPKKNVGLFEIEYQKPVTDDTWKKMHAEASACLQNFYSSGFFKELSADDKRSWLVIEDLEEFDFEGAKIYVKLDFARKKGNTIEIYDWKTGKDENTDASVQMGAYALYAMKKWGVGLGDIRAYLFNLANPPAIAKEQPLTEGGLETTKVFMRESIAGMQKLLLDVKRNIPLPRENFKYTENTRFCDSCNFYKICEKYQKQSVEKAPSASL